MQARYEVTKLRSNEGFAMAATLGVLSLLSVLVITVFANAMASFRSGMIDLEKSRTYYAAEAAAESAMAQLALTLEDAVIEDQELNAIVPPTIAGFTFDSFSVVRKGGVTTEVITDGPFAGLFSQTQVVEITAVAVSRDYTSSGIMVTAKAQAIPIFQFGVFFEKDLEINNGPRMDFDGWIHSNGNIYLNSDNQYFGDMITTPNNLYHDRKDEHGTDTGTYINDATATEVQLNFDSRDTPDPNDFRARSDLDFDNRVKTNAYGVDTLQVPLPDGVDPLTVIQPRNNTDGTLEQSAKFAWKADWYIDVDLSQIAVASSNANGNANGNTNGNANGNANGANGNANGNANGTNGNANGNLNGGVATGNGSLCGSAITHSRPVGVGVPNVNSCADIFSFGADWIYDGRELRYLDVLDVDVAELNAWATGTAQTSILYITMDPAGSQDPAGDGVYPVVRLVNAQTLANPITFSTNHPLYVLGDYNTVGWQPSALVGDAITFLSTAWNDAAHHDPVVTNPNAADTDIYAAIMAGHSGTPCDHEAAGCGLTSPYGGGLENFPRFLEDWNPPTLLFRGSLVSLHCAQQATGSWGCCVYYGPPVRDWRFDTRFELPENMPPGTPVVGNVIHTAFRPLF